MMTSKPSIKCDHLGGGGGEEISTANEWHELWQCHHLALGSHGDHPTLKT